MIRRLNRTGRRQIARSDVSVRLRSTEGNEPPIFDLNLNLGSYGFPPDSRVRVEAWRSNAVQRWDYGTVGILKEPPDEERRMRDVPQTAQFRVMVVAGDGSGRLLGHLPSTRPVLPQKSLLPVQEGRRRSTRGGSLASRLWRRRRLAGLATQFECHWYKRDCAHRQSVSFPSHARCITQRSQACGD